MENEMIHVCQKFNSVVDETVYPIPSSPWCNSTFFLA